ncbi:Kelch domain-containing protein 10 [Thelohanellus kitauei]|uniref:Kelch domain-containing protein 10 n=1 Tax=Thelohanellus kitauei TaxID=669202 RepID=A0A0C2NA63_THEKT|nr:Kelch domain-containing protein 10 [Thelohanellus kitauei]
MSVYNDHTGPEDRVYHSMTSVREFLIIYGGLTHWCREEHYGLWTFNTINGVWRRYELPIGVKDTPISSSICAVGNLVYIFGGTSLIDHFRRTNSLVSFDITNGTWQTVYSHTDIHDENTPPPMYGNLLFYHDGSLYVLRGFASDMDLDKLYKFTLKTSKWSLVQQNGEKPFLNNRIFGSVFKNQLYCFGHCLHEANRFRNVKIFDLCTKTWTERQTNSKTKQYPEDRIFESFVFSCNFGYLGGGRHPEHNTLYSDIWKVDLESLEWLKLNYTFKTGIKNHQMAVIKDVKLFSFGGGGDNPDSPHDLERFMVNVPTLYNLGLEYVSRDPKMKKLTDSLPSAILDELNLNQSDRSVDA